MKKNARISRSKVSVTLLDQNKTTCEHQEISRNSKLFQKLKVFCELQSFKMGKEDHFMAQMARLDGPAKFLHKSFTVQTDSISNVIGKKLSVESLMSSSTDKNKKDIKKSYAKTIEKKKKDNRQIFVPSIGNICMRFQLSGQTKPF